MNVPLSYSICFFRYPHWFTCKSISSIIINSEKSEIHSNLTSLKKIGVSLKTSEYI